jgi:hypothetical protein
LKRRSKSTSTPKVIAASITALDSVDTLQTG